MKISDSFSCWKHSALLTFLLCGTLQAQGFLHSIRPSEWVSFNQISDVNVTDDAIEASPTGPSPWLISERFEGVNAEEISAIVIRMSNTFGGRLHVFWATEDEPNFADSRLARVYIVPDGKMREYVFPTSKFPNWQGKIVRIRIDPGAYAEEFGQFRLESCELRRSTDSTAEAQEKPEALSTGRVSTTLALSAQPLSVPKSREDFFNSNGMRLKDGKPTFVLGLGNLPIVKAPFREVEESGFNTVIFPVLSKPLLQSLRQHRLNALYAPGAAFSANLTPEERRERLDKVAPLLEEYRDSLLGYFSDDEPAWRNIGAKEIVDGYQLINETLPKLPVFLNHAPRDTVDALKPYSKGADIIGCDIYPIPEGNGHSDLPNQTLSCVGDYTDKMREAAEPGQPIWMYLQAYPRGPKGIMPNFEESRFMAYNAITHGAQGIIYYGLRHLKWPNEMWPALQKLGKELRSIDSVLVAPWYSDFDATAKSKGIEIRHKRVDGEDYLFVLNTEKTPKILDWSVDLPSDTLHVLFEQRTLRKKDGRFEDELGPYAVRVYATAPLKVAPEIASSLRDGDAVLQQAEGISAQWIWDKEFQQAENTKLYFRYFLQVPAEVDAASILITADDHYRLYCNGKLVGEDVDDQKGGWTIAEVYDLKPYLRPRGRNLIAVEVENIRSWGGLLAEISFDGKVVATTDGKWRVFATSEPGWNTSIGFEDSSWKLADSFGKPPIEPWTTFLVPRNGTQ